MRLDGTETETEPGSAQGTDSGGYMSIKVNAQLAGSPVYWTRIR